MADYGGIFIDIAGEFFKLTWEDNGLAQSFIDGDDRLREKMRAVMDYQAPVVESYAKTNAPWTDQTGNARQGLRAQSFETGSNLGIILYGQVPYQIFLELKNGGQNAIIEPTIEVMGPQVMQALEKIMEQI